ncbi:DUF1772 domain-containing protein [Crossiella sp. SN42]|uniref:anthrone oxygenase family protein n=1 Tax=Crossiella sp. SN42 TaxID=2944808 RepID=UPI00207CAB25|nr:anthrone oxygenase family protein [Crossiella sp. SN42]MCO1580342.1 DUF1772 domain-containing protein [Crossiella sp. SN42]
MSVLALVAALANGVAAGIMLSTVIGIVPLMLALPYGQYVQLVRFLWRRYDPIMPALNGGVLLLDLLLAALAPQGRAAHTAAAVLLAAVVLISVSRNVPVNRYVTALDPAHRPADWARRDPRRRWRNWNLLRTGLATLAFLLNLIAL